MSSFRVDKGRGGGGGTDEADISFDLLGMECRGLS